MKILFMAYLRPNPDSGASGTEVQTIRALRESGHTVDTVWEEDFSTYIKHYNLYYLLELPLGYRQILKKKFLENRYDVVHVNQPHGYLAARTLRSLDSRAVFVHRSHGFEPLVRRELQRWNALLGTDSRPWWRRQSSRVVAQCFEISNTMIARYAHGHIVSASACRDFLHEEYGVPLDRIAVIPQAPPVEFQSIAPKPMTDRRLKRLLYVGQFAFIKAPMMVAAVVERVLARVPDATMTWVCDSKHHAEAARLFTRPEILNRVSFVGWTNQQKLIEVYDRHGIFLFPSFFEGFGKAFLEAMSRGLVVAASDTGGMKDVITDGQTGFLSRPGDAEHMAERVHRAIASPALSLSMSKMARDSAMAYTWQRVARETAQFYRSLINRNLGAEPL